MVLDARCERGDRRSRLLDSGREERGFLGQVPFHPAVEIVPRKPPDRDAIQIADARRGALEAHDVVARRERVNADLLLPPRAVQEALRVVLPARHEDVVEVHGLVERDLAGGAPQADLPDAARQRQDLVDGDRVLAGLLDAKRDLEPAPRPVALDAEGALLVGDAVRPRRGLDAGRRAQALVLAGRLDEDFLVDARRGRREGLGRDGDVPLVPEGDRGAEVRPVLEVVGRLRARRGIDDQGVAPALDVDPQGLREGDRRLGVPAVGREAAVLGVRLLDRHARVGVGEEPEVPGVVEVVLGSRPHDRRLLLAIDVEAVVGFPEPAPEARLQREHRADVVPGALAIEDDVRREGLGGELLAVARVEVAHAGRRRGKLHPVELPVDAQVVLALVGDLDARALPERHAPVAVERAAVRRHLDGQRVELGAHAVPRREEVADGRLDRRDGRAVPVHAQDERAVEAAVAAREREPHVADLAGALQLAQDLRLAGADMVGVDVGLRVVDAARRAARDAGHGAGDVLQDVGVKARRRQGDTETDRWCMHGEPPLRVHHPTRKTLRAKGGAVHRRALRAIPMPRPRVSARAPTRPGARGR